MDNDLGGRELLAVGAYLAAPVFIVVELLLFRWMMKRHRVTPKWATAAAFTAGGLGVYIYRWISGALAPPATAVSKLLATLRRFSRPDPWQMIVVVPLKEELLKTGLLLPFVASSLVGDRFDGLFYGLAVGMGFATIENIHLFQQPTRVDALLRLIWTRTIAAPITHGLSTAAIGLSIGWFKQGPLRMSRLPAIGGGLLAALAWHMAWNAVIRFGTPGDGSYPAIFVVSIAGALLTVVFTRRSIVRQASSAPLDETPVSR
jgi:RsiW-degrading membrane proteinase PrsW (M82 family)